MIPLVIVGGVAGFAGIVLGNAAIWQVRSFAERARHVGEYEMFASLDVIAPPTPGKQRQEAFATYKRLEPNGPLIKRLRVGQILTVTGVAVALVGAFL